LGYYGGKVWRGRGEVEDKPVENQGNWPSFSLRSSCLKHEADVRWERRRRSRFHPPAVQVCKISLSLSLLHGSARIILVQHLLDPLLTPAAGRSLESFRRAGATSLSTSTSIVEDSVTRSWFETLVGLAVWETPVKSRIRCYRGKGPRELAGEDGQTGTTLVPNLDDSAVSFLLSSHLNTSMCV
jgi:hypothetical protein